MKNGLIAIGIGVAVVIALFTLIKVVNKEQPPAVTIEPPQVGTIANTSWIVTTIGTESVADANMTLRFSEKSVSGTDGCNQFSGEFTADGNSLKISANLATTLMACPEETMVLASLFTTTLVETQSFTQNGSTLTLQNKDGKPIMMLAAQSNTLSGTSWNVTGYNNGNQAVIGVISDTAPMVEFLADGSVAGTAGCNRFNGGYETKEGSIAIGPLASTKMLCEEPAGLMDQEAAILTALQNAKMYQIDGQSLIFRDDQDAMQITATKK